MSVLFKVDVCLSKCAMYLFALALSFLYTDRREHRLQELLLLLLC